MSEAGSNVADRFRDEASRYGVQIGYWLLFLPLLSLYPLYYIFAKINEGRDIEEEMEDSPFHNAVGFSSGESIITPILSAVVAVAALFGIIYGPTFAQGNSIQLDVLLIIVGDVGLTTVGLLSGVFATFSSRDRFERDLLKRFGVSTGVGVLLGVIFSLIYISVLGWPIILSLLLKPFLVPVVAAVFGGAVANSYIVKEQEKKREGETQSTDDHTETKSYKGSKIDGSKGEKLLKMFAQSKWVVPDELHKSATIRKTRELKPLKDIVRKLWVEESHYQKTVPGTKFSSEKGKLRSDYGRREEVAPDGFQAEKYKFYKSGSKDVYSCDKCSGRGRLDCSNCSRDGTVRCGNCSGSGKNQCRKCRGNGRITVDETCGVCRGTGETSNGWECDNCGGYGSIEEEKKCPNCRRGKVTCSTCSGEGKVTCRSCGGSGTHDCGKCDACGQLVDYIYVERTYKPDKEVSYRTKSIPRGLLTSASGTRKSIETNDSPRKRDLYRRQDETREIPVVVTTYDYHSDRWELFDIEGSIEAREFPRDYQRQFQLVLGVLIVSTIPYVFLIHFPF